MRPGYAERRSTTVSMRAHIVTHHLEMTSPDELRPARASRDAYRWERVLVPSPELNHFLYRAVGGDWYWLWRIPWPRERWQAHVDRPELSTWVATVSGAPAGYAEVEAQAEGAFEILYFGLLPAFVGRGLGGAMLTEAVRSAWALGARRVWLHTCNLDHPHALAHYQARGFRVFKVEEHDEDVPDRSPGYWDR
jgi:ribosomal protein S18 acetylase RimI-like enzyme